MVKYILRYWRNKPFSAVLLFIGYFIGAFMISIGLSLVSMEKENIKNQTLGDSDKYFLADISSLLSKNKKYNFVNLSKELSSLGAVYFSSAMSQDVHKNEKKYNASVILMDMTIIPDWQYPILEGRGFVPSDMRDGKKNVIIGKYLAEKLSVQNIGEKIKIRDELYTVIGIEGRPHITHSWDEAIFLPMQEFLKNNSYTKVKGLISNNKGTPSINCIINVRAGKEKFQQLEQIIKTFFGSQAEVRIDKSITADVSSLRSVIITTSVVGGIIIFISIINVTSITLLWMSDRRKEMAVMKALGSTNEFIAFWTIIEMVMLATFSCGMAIMVHKILWILFKDFWLSKGLLIDIDIMYSLYIVFAGLVCGAVTAISPILQVFKLEPVEALKL